MSFDEGTTNEHDFLHEMETSVEAKADISDFEWELRNRQWEEQRAQVMGQMFQNNIWNLLVPKHKEGEEQGHEDGADHHQVKSVNASALRLSQTKSKKVKPTTVKSLQSNAVSNASRIVWKVPKMGQLELFKYLSNWDKSSFGKRDKLIMHFIRTYETKEKIYDTDAAFANGGSLIFCRFTVGLHMCFLKHRKVWHYYDALSIFVKSLQSDRYAEEFLRLGGMNYIVEVARVEESGEQDKLRACQFLINLMKSRNGYVVKQFICDTPHFLESIVDSLTMCKNKELIKQCGLIFENLCLEIPPANIPIVCNFVMHAIPCDFNPMLQSMAFKVLQNFIHMRPSLSTKCVKPILDNLKTSDIELLVAMSNLSLVILQTKYGDDLRSSLMVAAEGIQLREEFKNVARPHVQPGRGQTAKDVTNEMRKLRLQREKARQKQMKCDQYLHQAGALFVLNQMMTLKIDFVNDFVNNGVYGLSLKTLGTCPHWEVQGQGVTMVKLLFSISMDCALSYYMMLPPRMLELILTKPEECLRYFTSPICAYLRKLGRFALRMWPKWIEKVVSIAKLYARGPKIPPEMFQLNQMAKKVHEIHQAIADLLDSPVMEAAPRTPNDGDQSEVEREEHQEFLDSSDDENMGQYKDGKEVIVGDDRFEDFRDYLHDDTEEYKVSDDHLDIRLEAKSTGLDKDEEDKDLDAYQMAMLKDAENDEHTGQTVPPSVTEEDDENEQNEEIAGEELLL